jgi:hypothetical protein
MSDDRPAANDGSRADLGSLLDHRKRLDPHPLAESGARINARLRVDPGFELGRRQEQLDHPHERQLWLAHFDAGLSAGGQAGRYHHASSSAGRPEGPLIERKGYLGALGLLGGGHAINTARAIPKRAPPEVFGKLSYGPDGGRGHAIRTFPQAAHGGV